MSLSEEGIFSSSWMEESFPFDDLEQTTPQLRSLSRGFEDMVEIVNPNPNNHYNQNLKVLNVASCAAEVETKGAFKECTEEMDGLFGSPEPNLDDDQNDWEEELSQVVDEKFSDGVVPVMDETTKEMLVSMSVKEFNIQTKVLKLDPRVLDHLKLCRKRLRNRQAAIRSRSKKENETLFLQRRVDDLTRERDQQKAVIQQLQKRLNEIEKKVKSA